MDSIFKIYCWSCRCYPSGIYINLLLFLPALLKDKEISHLKVGIDESKFTTFIYDL